MIKTINVTAKDILLGERYDMKNCPVARAIHRVTKNKDIKVSITSIYSPINLDMIPTPKKIKDFITNFDGLEQVKPFKFKLEIPDEWIN